MSISRSSAQRSVALPSPPSLPLANLKPILYGPEVCQNLDLSLSKEWVITNGIGGYASSTIVGMNTRRAHGLLVAAAHPPVGRAVVLSSLEETVVTPQGRYDLAAHRYAHGVHPEGYRYLAEFRFDPCPTFLYRIGSILLEKKVFLLPGENAAVIGYTLYAASGPVELAVRPLLAVRDFRWVCRENPQFRPRMEERPGVINLHPYEELPAVMIHHTAELFDRSPCWYKNFDYLHENELIKQGQEDLWSPGDLLYLLKVGESCAVVVSTGRRGGVDLSFHERRLENTQTVSARSITPPGEGPLATRLSWTAESFLIHQPAGGTFLLAGFPSLGPWGRDTLIALPGLTLATKRFEVARALLETLASKVKSGLLPVRFAEEDGSPEYDSADTSLWFFWAVWHYWKATRDLKFIRAKLLDPMRQIMEAYLEGTDYGIGMDEDGLIQLSEKEFPLTWMDAREPGTRGDLPGPAVTPRFGKPVEVNALWYCALSVMAVLGEHLGVKRADAYGRLSQLVQEHFIRTFRAPDGCLYDCVTERTQDGAIRPNMLIAASLPFSPISRSQAAHVLAAAETLLTPFGLRTLSPKDSRYRGRYVGDLKDQARAYHQGTVWPWLLGPYVSTVIRVHRLTRATQSVVKKQLEPFRTHLHEEGLGSIGEIFDGDPPHAARGGISQAWSVGEILRAVHEAKLGDL